MPLGGSSAGRRGDTLHERRMEIRPWTAQLQSPLLHAGERRACEPQAGYRRCHQRPEETD
jgi:hypothetical protein